MEVVDICETSVDVYGTTRCNVPEGCSFHTRRNENDKSHISRNITRGKTADARGQMRCASVYCSRPTAGRSPQRQLLAVLRTKTVEGGLVAWAELLFCCVYCGAEENQEGISDSMACGPLIASVREAGLSIIQP